MLERNDCSENVWINIWSVFGWFRFFCGFESPFETVESIIKLYLCFYSLSFKFVSLFHLFRYLYLFLFHYLEISQFLSLYLTHHTLPPFYFRSQLTAIFLLLYSALIQLNKNIFTVLFSLSRNLETSSCFLSITNVLEPRGKTLLGSSLGNFLGVWERGDAFLGETSEESLE